MLRITVRYANQALHFDPPAGPAGEVTLGASSENDFVLPFPGISRRHAKLTCRDGGLWVSDLGSKNGLLRGEHRHAEVLLRLGEKLQIGKAFLLLEEIASSDAEIAFTLPGTRKEPAKRRPSSETDPIFETGGDATPGSALALVRRIETSSRLELGTATTSQLLEHARQTLAAELLVVLGSPTAGDDAAISAIAGPPALTALLAGLDFGAVSAPGDGVPALRIADNRFALVRRLARKPTDLFLAALLPSDAGKPAGWKLDFFAYLAEKLVPAHRKPTPPPATARPGEAAADPEADPLRYPPELVRGPSEAMEKLFHHLRATVKSTMDVLLLGETGTGKELIAKLVHASGPSSKGPFIAINCAAIPAELLEAELFGVEARVATGVDPRPGLFVKAEGGTIFLDEIGDMPEPLQAKLLRVLQEREVLPVGSHQPKKIKVRVISASNKNIAERVEAGSFRADLYYRLRGLQFHLPPLRERVEDIPALVLAFASDIAKRYDQEIRGVSRSALDLLASHDWPGNIRELKSEIERAILLLEACAPLTSKEIGPVKYSVERATLKPDQAKRWNFNAEGADRQMELAAAKRGAPDSDTSSSLPTGLLQTKRDALERLAIQQALAGAYGNKTKAAQLLGITRNGLALKMRRLNIR